MTSVKSSSLSVKSTVGVVLIITMLLVYLAVVVRTAWLCDDAYITLRTVDNFIHGYGLTWNVNERVQAYTHPLWMFLLSFGYYLTREEYYTTLFLSIGVSLLAALFLAIKIPKTLGAAVFGLAALTFSKAFIDYSTSGLENPLSHLILVLFLWVFFDREANNRSIFLLSFLAGLGVLNRMDIILIFLPAVLYKIWEGGSVRVVFAACLGFVPVVLWMLFSTYYYGFPFPNTAYAKLANGMTPMVLRQHGIDYLLNSWRYDPITLLTVAIASVVSILRRRLSYLAIILGISLYLIYIVKIGGDFMSGRFLTGLFLCSVVLIMQLPFKDSIKSPWLLAISAVIVIGMIAPFPTILSDASYRPVPPGGKFVDPDGIADERAFYFPATGLIVKRDGPPNYDNLGMLEGRKFRESGEKLVIVHNIGFAGFFAGPEVHILDTYGLGDPLLARIPVKPKPGTRIGHVIRLVPCGYGETLVSGVNQIKDRDLAFYYDKLALATRGDLFDTRRLKEIWNLNTGKYDDYIKTYHREWRCD